MADRTEQKRPEPSKDDPTSCGHDPVGPDPPEGRVQPDLDPKSHEPNEAEEDSTTEVDPIRKIRPPARVNEQDAKATGEPRAAAPDVDRPDLNTAPPPTRLYTEKEAKLAEDEAQAYKIVKADTTFGRYQLLMEMARGGMATLYLGRIRGPQKFQKLVAIKKIHNHLAREPNFINMFLDEARIAALIHHPNVASIFDLGKTRGAYYIAMEYVHGQNLTDILRSCARQRIPFEWSHAVRVVADAAAGLHAAHELSDTDGKPMNVVHRDVSPQNILVSYDGNVKVVDFGVAYAREKLVQTAVGTVKGKAAYMSPEQTRGEQADRRSDIFSLGIVLWESTCMRRLFREKNEASTLLKVRRAEIPRPRSIRPELPVGLERIILKALSRAPQDRFSTAGEMAEQLEELLVKEGRAVGPQKLAKTMERLFYDRKTAKDKQIKQALRNESSEGLQAMLDSSGTSLDLPQVDSAELKAKPRKRSLAMTLAAGAVFAAGAIILAVTLLFRSGASTSTEKPGRNRNQKRSDLSRPADGKDSPSRKSGTVTLAVRVKPDAAKAEVVFRGNRYKGSHFQVVVPRSKNPETIEVRARGYLPQNLVMIPVEDGQVTVTLRPRPRPRARHGRKPSPRKPDPRKLLRDLPM